MSWRGWACLLGFLAFAACGIFLAVTTHPPGNPVLLARQECLLHWGVAQLDESENVVVCLDGTIRSLR